MAANDATTSAFDDADELTDFLGDERSSDTVCLSTVSDALAVVDAFRAAPPSAAKSPWTSLDRGTLADGLAALVRDSRSITQSALNLCGPAAFFNIAAGRHPAAVARAAAALFDTGQCDLGGLRLQPRADLMATDYASMATKMSKMSPGRPASQAEWMLLGALRNTTAVWWLPDWRGDPAQELAASTRTEELSSWLQSTGFFRTVNDGGRWSSHAGIPNAEDLSCSPGTDNALLVNVNLLASAGKDAFDNTFLLNAFPNHWVVLVSEVVADREKQTVTFSVWTWGQSLRNLTISYQAFVDNYYGAITTTTVPDGA
jgi:hypothetical protein